MSYGRQGAHFLSNLLIGSRRAVRRDPEYLDLLSGERLVCDVYRPYLERTVGTVLFVHGMNERGPKDPRMVDTAKAMARMALKVVVPRFEDIADSVISEVSIAHIAGAVLALAERHDRLGLLAPSFSAALSMIAVCEPTVAARLTTICSIGGFAEADSVVRRLILDEGADEYGRLIIYKNFFSTLVGDNEAVQVAIETRISDQALPDEEPRFPAYYARLAARDRAIIDSLLFDPAQRAQNAERIITTHAALLAKLSVTRVGCHVSRPVALIHGATDKVIDPNESRRLATALTASGSDVYLAITPLISHGDSTPSLRHLPHVIDLARGFGHFLGPLLRDAS